MGMGGQPRHPQLAPQHSFAGKSLLATGGCSSRDRLAFCQSHSEGRSWLLPSKVQALSLQPVEPDTETLLAGPASNSGE